MKKMKIPLIITVCALLVTVVAYALIAANRKDNSLPANVSRELGCERLTLDARPTDKYCGNYELYKKDKAAGIVD